MEKEKTKIISVRISESAFNELKKVSEREYLTNAALVRRIIMNYLRNEQEKREQFLLNSDL